MASSTLEINDRDQLYVENQYLRAQLAALEACGVASRVVESPELSVVLAQVAQRLAVRFNGTCHIFFTSAQRAINVREAIATASQPHMASDE
ncbi:MAG: hypothetical protein WCG26_10310 [Chloroflexales bacterium]